MTIVAERAGISRQTLSKIHRGDPTVGMGAYAMVVMALGMGTSWVDFADIANDTWGQSLADEELPAMAVHFFKGLKKYANCQFYFQLAAMQRILIMNI